MLIEAREQRFIVRQKYYPRKQKKKDVEKRVCFECAINYSQNPRPWKVCVPVFLTRWKRRDQIESYQSAQTSHHVLPARYIYIILTPG